MESNPSTIGKSKNKDQEEHNWNIIINCERVRPVAPKN